MERETVVMGVVGRAVGASGNIEISGIEDFTITVAADEDGKRIAVYHEDLDICYVVPFEPIEEAFKDLQEGE